ncbi:MAG: GNAT family N-acetyltransferase [Thermoplasmata archaeon]|nr:MAG: GNAT family N-acetyltransferase [Thermoplasmata archaeon]
MNGLTIREGVLRDRASLDELFREELEYHMNLQPDVFKIPDTVVSEKWLKAIINDNNIFLGISEYNGKIVGAILYKIDKNPEDNILKERKFVYVEDMIVSESFRGKGIGKKLLNYAIKHVKTKDIKEIEIDVGDNNEVGLRFYKEQGFKTIRRRMKKEIV